MCQIGGVDNSSAERARHIWSSSNFRYSLFAEAQSVIVAQGFPRLNAVDTFFAVAHQDRFEVAVVNLVTDEGFPHARDSRHFHHGEGRAIEIQEFGGVVDPFLSGKVHISPHIFNRGSGAITTPSMLNVSGPSISRSVMRSKLTSSWQSSQATWSMTRPWYQVR